MSLLFIKWLIFKIYKELWVLKNWCFWTVVLEKTLESPLDYKEIQSVHPKGNQSWIFIGRTDVEAETPILWLPYAKSRLIGKDPDAGKDWRQKKGTTEDEMVGWHHQLDRHEFEQASGAGDGQGSLECCSSWGLKDSDVTEWLNWTALLWVDTFVQSSAPTLRAHTLIKPPHPLTQTQYLNLSLPQDSNICISCFVIFYVILLEFMDFSFWLLYNLCCWLVMFRTVELILSVTETLLRTKMH